MEGSYQYYVNLHDYKYDNITEFGTSCGPTVFTYGWILSDEQSKYGIN